MVREYNFSDIAKRGSAVRVSGRVISSVEWKKLKGTLCVFQITIVDPEN